MAAPLRLGQGTRSADLAYLWRRYLLALALTCGALLLAFRSDAATIAHIWWTSSTFGHCLFILPLVGWLLWERRAGLARLTPRAWLPGLALVGLGGLAWLTGETAGVALARHLGLVMIVQGAAVTLLGPSVVRGMLFPLFYLFFLVPAGEGLEPFFQTLTARMCMGLLALAGIPAQLSGVFITTPHGYFEVAEACSGVKFLVAMLAYGVLAAHVCFKSWTRRILFLAFALVVSVLANGVRAWGTIYVAERIDTRFAEGFDHVVYGWIFFGLVIGAVMAASWRFFDRPRGEPWFDPARIEPVPPMPQPRARLAMAAIVAILVGIAPIAWSMALAARGTVALPTDAELPVVPGWTRVPMASGPFWRPRFDGADRRLIGRYRDASGREVDLAIVVFTHQAEGRELVGYGHGAVDPDGHWAWTDDTAPPAHGSAVRILAPGPVVREVASFYRVGDVTTGSDAIVKLETLKVRLLGGPQRAVAVLVSAQGGGARPTIDAFLMKLGPIDRIADRAAGMAR